MTSAERKTRGSILSLRENSARWQREGRPIAAARAAAIADRLEDAAPSRAAAAAGCPPSHPVTQRQPALTPLSDRDEEDRDYAARQLSLGEAYQ